MWADIMENWVFWTTVGIVHILVLLISPKTLITLYFTAAILYVLTGLFSGHWYSLYGFFGWMMGALLILPFAGVPLIIMLIGGYAAGRWMAKL